MLQTFLRICEPGQTVLDVGCGSGIVGTALHDRGYTVVGCDVSPGILSVFREQMGERKIELREGDGASLPCGNEEFDAVVSRIFISHFPNWRKILREKARVAKTGGIIYFDFANAAHLDRVPGIEDAEYGSPYTRDKADEGRFYAACTPKQMERTAAKLGLEVVAMRPRGLMFTNAHL